MRIAPTIALILIAVAIGFEDTAICTYVALIQGGVAAAWVGLVVMGLGVGAMAGAVAG